jgi:hypothetical protein
MEYIEKVREIQMKDLDVDEEHREILFAIYELVDTCFEKCDKFLGFRERQEVLRIPRPEKLQSTDPTVLDSFAFPKKKTSTDTDSSSSTESNDEFEHVDEEKTTKEEREARLRKEREATAELLEMGLDLTDDEMEADE